MKKPNIPEILNQIDWNCVEFIVSMKRHLNQPCPEVTTNMRKLGESLLKDLVKSPPSSTAISCGLLRASRHKEEGIVNYRLSFIPFVADVWL